MKIFISSVIRGFEQYRETATRAARSLRHEVRRAEDFTASPDTPQQACLAGVRWADVVVLILGARYGERQASELSATHEEYREARERCPVLVFLQKDVQFEAPQKDFLREVQDWTRGHYTASFRDPEEFRDAVTVALRDLELSRAVGPVDEGEMLARAKALVPPDRHAQRETLTLVVTGGPSQQIVRPRELEAPELEETLAREAMFGPFRIFDRRLGARGEIRGDALVIEQETGSILLDQFGTVRLILPAQRPRDQSGMIELSVLIQEDVQELIQRALRFSGWVLDHIDPVRRISDVVPLVSLHGGLAWRTRAEHERSPHSFPVRLSSEPVVVTPSPARRHRAALTQNAAALAEDFTALLGRRMRG